MDPENLSSPNVSGAERQDAEPVGEARRPEPPDEGAADGGVIVRRDAAALAEARAIADAGGLWTMPHVEAVIGLRRRMIQDLPIPRVRIGARVFFDPREVRAWLDRQKTSSLLTGGAPVRPSRHQRRSA